MTTADQTSPLPKPSPAHRWREFVVLGLLAVAVLGMGLYPLPFTEVMHHSVNNLLSHVAQSKL